MCRTLYCFIFAALVATCAHGRSLLATPSALLPNNYLQAIQLIGTPTASSAEECQAACVADAACTVWAWCPATQTAAGCTVDYGDIAPGRIVAAGGCQLTANPYPVSFSYSAFGSQGSSVPFTSGTVTRDTAMAPTPAAGPTAAPAPAPSPDAAPASSPAPSPSSSQPPSLPEDAFFCDELPEAQRQCGEQAFADFKEASPSTSWLEATMQLAMDEYNAENWRGLVCSPGGNEARVACQNKNAKKEWVLVFDADCGDAGPATFQAYLTVNNDDEVKSWGLVDTLCRP